jgi:hypothetical protein
MRALKGIEIKKEVIITKVDDASGDYVIPEEIDGCVVTGIGNRSFANCKNLRSVAIPESVSQIDRGAFYCCDCLESFYVAKENVRYKAIDGFLIEDDDTLVAIPGNIENVKIVKATVKNKPNAKIKIIAITLTEKANIMIGDATNTLVIIPAKVITNKIIPTKYNLIYLAKELIPLNESNILASHSLDKSS